MNKMKIILVKLLIQIVQEQFRKLGLIADLKAIQLHKPPRITFPWQSRAMTKKGLYPSVESEYYASLQFKDYGYLGPGAKTPPMRTKNPRILHCYPTTEAFKLLGQ